MKRLFAFASLAVLFSSSCKNDNKEPQDNVTVISHDTIPETRETVQSKPVAEYNEPIKDELNKWQFAVSLYETKRTFHYAMFLQGKEVRVNDSISIPNFGIQPKVEIHKGHEPLSCIIGFLNKKGEFMEYLGVNFRDDQLHVKTINHFAVNAYKTPVK